MVIAGIATEGDYRFRISMDASDTDKRLRQRAKFLVPNTNNNFNFDEYSQDELRNSTDFTVNEQLSTITDGTQYENDITNQYNYLEEFYPFRWKKVYTVKQYIGRMQKSNGNDEARGFIGIKDIINSEGVNKFPSNRFDTSINPLYSILCILLSFVGHLIGFVNGLIMMINGLISEICNVKYLLKLNLVIVLPLQVMVFVVKHTKVNVIIITMVVTVMVPHVINVGVMVRRVIVQVMVMRSLKSILGGNVYLVV